MGARSGGFRSIVPTVAACATLMACATDPGATWTASQEPAAKPVENSLSLLVAPVVTESLKAPAGETLAMRAHGRGVQVYACAARAGEGSPVAWEHQGAETDLTDDSGQRLGRHYAGPTWQANDGSKVVGEVVTKSPAPDPHNAKWLLIKARATSGTGVLSRVTSIQRVDTVGGRPPSEGCDASHLGDQQRVPFEAAYYFYEHR